MRQPSKLPIILNSLTLLTAIAVSVLHFVIDKPLAGWIWAVASVVWVFSIALSVRTYRIQQRTAEIYARIGRQS